MNVYEFEKSLLERMEESCNVLQCKESPVPASEVREEWACHVELKIEPAGWQAIWKINRATCEQFKINYPTTVFGTVNNVYFQDLMADFAINAVQDDEVHLPEVHEVPLEDLWPTINQENPELMVERTADCIDELRFFYRNVWMPWDNDSDEVADWCKKHLESRIRFCFDLKRDMSRGMADHIRKLLSEARYIQNKREIMELEMSDDEEDAEEDREKVEQFTQMQLRLVEIRNEVEMLENPTFRRTYENLHFKEKSKNNNIRSDQKANNFIVTMEDTINKQMEFVAAVAKLIGGDEVVKFNPSLKDCLKVCASNDHIYLPPSRHTIRVLEPLNSGGLFTAIYSEENNKIEFDCKLLESNEKPILATDESDNVFLSFNGDYTIENLILDCRQVRIGIWVKAGTVTFKNCCLIGDHKSSTGVGIAIADEGKCVLEKTLIQNFATGVYCASGGVLVTNQATITNCGSGIEIHDTGSLEIRSSQIANNSDYAIFVRTKAENVIENGKKKKIVSNFDELCKLIPQFSFAGDCALNGNSKGNIAIIDQNKIILLQHSEFIENNYNESGFKKADVSMSNGEIANRLGSPISIDDEESFVLETNTSNVSIIYIE